MGGQNEYIPPCVHQVGPQQFGKLERTGQAQLNDSLASKSLATISGLL